MKQFDKEIIIVTPWFGEFAGGAERLARGMAVELGKRGVRTKVFTTCSRSPYDSWWEDYYVEGTSDEAGVEVRRFATVKESAGYLATIEKLQNGQELTPQDEEDFFVYGINSRQLTEALARYLTDDYEIIALPYFHGLTHSVVNRYRGKISIVPCFHDEPQFKWEATQKLLTNAKNVFFNSIEERDMTIKRYGASIGRKIVEGIVTGVGVEIRDSNRKNADAGFVPDEKTEGEKNVQPVSGQGARNGKSFGRKIVEGLLAGIGVEILDSDNVGTNAEDDRLRLPENYFVYAGRKERGKNVDLLCGWFAHYAAENQRNVKLVFIGGGDASLVPQGDEHFIDYGFVSETEKQRVIKSANALINLSLNESFSIVLMEGWLLGVPAIVSSGCAVTSGHVRRCNGGLFVDNYEEFALALRLLERNREVASELGRCGQSYVAANFSFDAVLLKYLSDLSASC
jgi:glycosyltransferase involved in cell wall biosynthesis